MKFFIAFLLSIFSVETFAQSLSEAEILYRCYGHLTSKRLKKTHPLLQRVKSGEISGTEACEVVLSMGSLKTNGQLQTNNRESRAVLGAMTKLHMTFFDKQALVGGNTTFTLVGNDIYDEQASALHYTKALFVKNHGIDDILKAKKDLEGRRTDPLSTVRGPSSNYLASKFTRTKYPSGKAAITPNFVMTGSLEGLRDARAFNVPQSTWFGSTRR